MATPKPTHRELVRSDHQNCWHPFTQMQDWLAQDPIVIASGKGSILTDTRGRNYLDANSSIWTNLHGHRHPRINAAILRQLNKISHSSYLGLANEPASLLAKQLVQLANRTGLEHGKTLSKVFFSDDGSTAMETALKMAHGYSTRTLGIQRPRFASMNNAYHGDTVGAVSLGHIDLFHNTYKSLLFSTARIPSPYCYRCPWNRAKPERGDARACRRCEWECLNPVKRLFSQSKKRGRPISALVVEPVMQGAAGMIAQPQGWLRKVAHIAREHDALVIADEVMTAFGRVSEPALPSQTDHPMILASHQEGVQPDLAAVAKGLSGGYLPFAATLASSGIFDAFLGRYDAFKTFFHGHSYTGNALGAAASSASLEILQSRSCTQARIAIVGALEQSLATLWSLPNVGDIRRAGTAVGVELVRNWRTREPFPIEEKAGIRVCNALSKMGVLTRPIGNVIVLMPPYSTTPDQVHQIVDALRRSIQKVHGK